MEITEYARCGYGNIICGTGRAKIDDMTDDLFIELKASSIAKWFKFCIKFDFKNNITES
jgi:hypothetical protein